MKRERKIYEPSFKTKVVELSTELTNISEHVRELGISVTLLYEWHKDHEEFGKCSFPSKGNLKLTPEHEKRHELEKRRKDAELDRDIFKKAIGIFSKSGR